MQCCTDVLAFAVCSWPVIGLVLLSLTNDIGCFCDVIIADYSDWIVADITAAHWIVADITAAHWIVADITAAHCRYD